MTIETTAPRERSSQVYRTVRDLAARAADTDLRQLGAFVAVGATGAAGYAVIASLLAWAGLEPWLASICGTLTVIPPTYLGQKVLTFRSTSSHARTFPRYVAVQCLSIVVAAMVSQAVARAGLPPPVGFVGAGGLVATMSFVLLKLWSFAAPP